MTHRQTAEALATVDPRVTAKDAATLLGVSLRTLDRYQAAGILTPTPTPRAPRMFRVADIAPLRGAK
jgi:DNA-binding transcriptional MerR regulator